jgi:hypothetical protein
MYALVAAVAAVKISSWVGDVYGELAYDARLKGPSAAQGKSPVDRSVVLVGKKNLQIKVSH